MLLLLPPDPGVLSGRVILNCVPWTRHSGLRGEALKEKNDVNAEMFHLWESP